jgi:protein SCO1/2
MLDNSKISANNKRVLLFSIFIIPTVLCFAFYIFMIRKPFLENPSGLYKKLNYYGSKHLAENGKDTIYTQIPNFSFINQAGKTVTQNELNNNIYIAAFICTTCSTSCPKIAAQFFRMQKKVNYIKSFTVVSHTVYPEKETPEVLSQYARLVHADPNYCNFFTGNRKDLETVARDGYEIKIDSTMGLVHQSSLYLVDKNKHIRGIYDGTSTTDVNRLIDEIKVLDAEYRVAKRNK